MAELIEIRTPERFVAMGKQFRDFSLDASSLRDNCKRIADEMTKDRKIFKERDGRTRQITPSDVLDASSAMVAGLGAVVRGHVEFMRALGGQRP